MFPIMARFNFDRIRPVEEHEVASVVQDDAGYLLITLKSGVVCKSGHRVARQPDPVSKEQ